MEIRPRLGLGLLVLAFLASSAHAADVPPLPPIDDQGGQGGGSAPDPGGPGADPLNPDDTIDGAKDAVDGLNGGGYAPSPPGTNRGLDRIGDDVGDVLAENWAVTGLITLGLLGVGSAGWFLASRYVDPKVALRSPERSMLYGFVKGNPGVHLKQLSSEFGMKTSTVLWHVRKLEAADLIRSKKANGYRVFYPVSGGIEASRVSEAVTALSNANARDIFHFLVERPLAHPRLLTETLSINPGTVRWHLKKLVKAGLLEEHGERRGVEYRTTELGVKALRQLQGQPVSQPLEVEAVATPAPEPEIVALN